MPEQEAVVAAINALRGDLESRHSATDETLAKQNAQLADQGRKIDQLLKAFPDADVEGHRRYHEEVMQGLAERKRIRQALLVHVLKSSTWAVLLGLGAFALYSVKHWIASIKGTA
jgi:hypothetical protein